MTDRTVHAFAKRRPAFRNTVQAVFGPGQHRLAKGSPEVLRIALLMRPSVRPAGVRSVQGLARVLVQSCVKLWGYLEAQARQQLGGGIALPFERAAYHAGRSETTTQ